MSTVINGLTLKRLVESSAVRYVPARLRQRIPYISLQNQSNDIPSSIHLSCAARPDLYSCHIHMPVRIPRAVYVRLRRERLQRQLLEPRQPRHLLSHNVTPARLLRVAILDNVDGEIMGTLRGSGASPDTVQDLVHELMELSGTYPATL